MKTIKGLKTYTHEEVFAKSFKSENFRKLYNEEYARMKMVYQIKKMRSAKRLTQKMLAEKADMPQSVIARIESGKHGFSLGTLSRIAKVFGKEIQLA